MGTLWGAGMPRRWTGITADADLGRCYLNLDPKYSVTRSTYSSG